MMGQLRGTVVRRLWFGAILAFSAAALLLSRTRVLPLYARFSNGTSAVYGELWKTEELYLDAKLEVPPVRHDSKMNSGDRARKYFVIADASTPNNQTDSSQVPHSPEVRNLRNYDYTVPPQIRHSMEDRYLFPVVNFDGGPNFQYRQFKTAVQIAVYTNRTIVMPEFNHQRLLQAEGRISFEETFDVQVFQRFMPAVSIEQYREKCSSIENRVLYVPRIGYTTNAQDLPERYSWQKSWLRVMYNITIPDQSYFPRSDSVTRTQIHEMSDERCLVLVLPIAFESLCILQELGNTMEDAVDGHLVRAPILRKAVEATLPKLCNGKPILGFHWRNKTGEVCRIGRLQYSNSSRCKDLHQVHEEVIAHLAEAIKRLERDNGIRCTYVAYPPDENESLPNILSPYLPNVITINDVLKIHNPSIDSFKDDDYFISLVEQEICARAKVFIGNGKSNWSTFVFRERRSFAYGPSFDILSDFFELSEALKGRY